MILQPSPDSPNFAKIMVRNSSKSIKSEFNVLESNFASLFLVLGLTNSYSDMLSRSSISLPRPFYISLKGSDRSLQRVSYSGFPVKGSSFSLNVSEVLN